MSAWDRCSNAQRFAASTVLGANPVEASRSTPNSEHPKPSMPDLPIHRVRQRILAELDSSNRLVLTAPTGTGKSTQIPQFLLDSGRIQGQILVLQPRRLAARFLAARVAQERGTELGNEIGFQTRFESCLSAGTRVRFMTEGILPRLFLSDPTLKEVGAIILDEFHERPLSSDIGLGLVKRLQEIGRADLKLVVMSATLQTEPLQAYLQGSAVVNVEARNHPVQVSYLPPRPEVPVWEQAAKALVSLLREQPGGDVLIFMPGAFEIRRTIETCKRLSTAERLDLLPLYGELPREQQDRIMAPADGRKVIVATNIAETSLTIPGIRHVIDSGLVRLSRFDPARGFNTLNLETISRHSAEQRTGRAGREAPGTAIRLWPLAEQMRRPAATDAEIHRTDLAEIVLPLKALGFDDPADFPWFEAPEATAISQAMVLLTDLGALDHHTGRLTDLGRQMANFPAHPRLARLMIEAHHLRCLNEVTLIAAILSERPVILNHKEGLRPLAAQFPNTLETNRALHSDFFLLANALHEVNHRGFSPPFCEQLGISPSAARQVWRTYAYFLDVCRKNRLAVPRVPADPEAVLRCLLVAFPDHLAKRRDAGTLVCRLRGDKHAELSRGSSVRDADLLVVGERREIGGGGRPATTTLSMASQVRLEWLEELFPEEWEFEDEHVWNDVKREVERHSSQRCLGVLLERSVSREVEPDRAAEILAAEVTRKGLAMKGWDEKVDAWVQRVRWLAEVFPERGLIVYDDTDRLLIMQEICAGERRYAAIKNKDCMPFVQNALSWDDQQFVKQMAPERITLPNGKPMRIRYRPGHPPQGRARIQELYGLDKTPCVANGKIPLLLEILAPNMRAIQITDSLERFWNDLYPTVKKELSRRYPKHEWR